MSYFKDTWKDDLDYEIWYEEDMNEYIALCREYADRVNDEDNDWN